MNTKKRNKTVLLLAIMVMIWLSSVANAFDFFDLIAYWPLDEGIGDIAYDAIGDNDGQLVDDPTWISPGQVGAGALDFGGGNYVNCGIGVTAAPDLTVALWIRANGYAYQRPIACSTGGYSPEPGWIVMLRNDDPPGGVWFRIDGSGGDWDSGDVQVDETVYEPDTWVHMAFTFDSVTREQKCYINGELKGTDTAAVGRSVANTVDELRFGSDTGAGELYSGMLDELIIWDIALTAEEVLDVYRFGVSSDPNAPSANAGPDMITVSELSVDMDATVINNDTYDPKRPLAYEWTAVPDTGVVFEPDEFVLNPTVTITDPAPNNPTTYTLTLSAQLVNPSGPPEKAVLNYMNIDVYSDDCKAIVAAALPSPYDPGDVNLDCITDLRDLAISSVKWLGEYQLTEPAVKPAAE